MLRNQRSRTCLGLAYAFTVCVAIPAMAGFDVPTGAAPSPLFGAEPFTQPIVRFEEFGLRPLPSTECVGCSSMPSVSSCASTPNGTELDDFIDQRIWPMPTEAANENHPNPWEPRIEQCIRPMAQTFIEGRPPGMWFSHQRWDEYYPEVYFESVTTGARTNGGVRDAWQRHGYSLGEFGPGGLYHSSSGAPGSAAGLEVRFHPNMPTQDSDTLWTFDGTLPPKILMARYGEVILFRNHNGLPIDPSANNGFGLHTLTTHEHNGHSPAESDGYTSAFFFPGQFFDYRWPMILAGRDHINTDATDLRAGHINDDGSVALVPGDWRETMSTHWFHDHMLDFTAQNVYKGIAAAMNYYSVVDRGHESRGCHYEDPGNVNLCFPSGTDLEWGNRDYDVNLLLADKAWDASGQLFFNIFNMDGFLGDRMTVNWLYKPYMEVRARRYRFRILNGSVSRYMKIAITTESGERVPYHMIANDGNVMEHAVPFPNAESKDLPIQAIAERYDIVIDLSPYEGRRLLFWNLLEHEDGRGPEEEVSLQNVRSGSYFRDDHDPGVGAFLELRVVPYSGTDTSMNPADYEPGKKKMIPLPSFSDEELANALHRTFEFGRSNGTDSMPWTIKTDGGQGLTMDPRRLSAAPEENRVEIWHLENGTGGGWSHPVHIHFEEGQILNRDGGRPPIWERYARKDVIRIGPLSGRDVDVALRFREFRGTYMEHCHNTQHEDHAMLLRYDVENPGQMIAMPTPSPTWEGVFYEDTFALSTYKVGDLDAAEEGVRDRRGETCGNAVLEAGEQCDDGNGLSGDGCDGLCQVEGAAGPVCGNGVLESGEVCDDGNLHAGDGCGSRCLPEREVLRQVKANRKGRVKARGAVEQHIEIEADHPAISCRTRDDGRYRCRGRGLEPGTVVNIIAVPVFGGESEVDRGRRQPEDSDDD